MFYASFDVRRYLPLLRCLAAIALVFGAAMLVLDIAVGLPLFWIILEGPFIIGLGCVVWWLAGRAGAEAAPAD